MLTSEEQMSLSTLMVKGFKLRGLPTTILINKEGKEFGKVIGEIDFASDEFINFLRKYI